MTMTRTGSPDEDYGCCGQLVQGINDTIYAYGGDNEVNGFNSDYDPLEEALYKPGGLYGPPADPEHAPNSDYDPEDQEDLRERERVHHQPGLQGRVRGL